MKRIDIKNKLLWGISMIALLGFSYWLCRYIFFEVHGMRQWPDLLAVFSIAILVIAAMFGNRSIPVSTIVGYMVGFIIAMIYNTDGVDPGGGRTNNAWIIWGMIYILSILIGFIISYILKKKHESVKK